MPPAKPAAAMRELAPFRALYAPPDEGMAAALLAGAARPTEAEARIDARATRLVTAIRARVGGLGGVEDFLHAYALSTKEGLALMVLAEALLRVPDADTADRLIEDKLKAGDWAHHDTRSAALWCRPRPGRSASRRASSIRARRRRASSRRWSNGSACRRCARRRARRCACSARTSCWGRPSRRRSRAPTRGASFFIPSTCWARAPAPRHDAERYFESYAERHRRDRQARRQCRAAQRPGISVKLSALHPRYEPLSRERVLKELAPRLLDLARRAKTHELNLTVDAEEADRLELSLDVFAAVLRDPSLAGWDGFGLRCRPIRSAPAR